MIEGGRKNSSPAAPVRRRAPRYRADLRVRVVLATPVPVVLHARCSDLSTGGVSVIVPQEHFSEAIAMIGLRTPGTADYVWLRARLRHHAGFRCGFQFVETTLEQTRALRDICRSLPT